MSSITPIKILNGKKVRIVWSESSSTFLYSATDLVLAFTSSKNPRIYWNAIKRRHPEIKRYCFLAKLRAADNKLYNSDLLNYEGINELVFILKHPNRKFLISWLKGENGSIDEQAIKRAQDLYDINILNTDEIGTFLGLRKIHAYLFDGLYPNVGKVRNKNVPKGNIEFANYTFLKQILIHIDNMSSGNFNEIVEKYVEMNIAHPFLDGCEQSMRLWLDMILKIKLGKCINWAKIRKEDYLEAMAESPYNDSQIKNVFKRGLSNKILDKNLFQISLNSSFFYEK